MYYNFCTDLKLTWEQNKMAGCSEEKIKQARQLSTCWLNHGTMEPKNLKSLKNMGAAQAVCALRSLSIMGGIQNLIICVKMAWSEHLDCGVNIR